MGGQEGLDVCARLSSGDAEHPLDIGALQFAMGEQAVVYKIQSAIGRIGHLGFPLPQSHGIAVVASEAPVPAAVPGGKGDHRSRGSRIGLYEPRIARNDASSCAL